MQDQWRDNRKRGSQHKREHDRNDHASHAKPMQIRKTPQISGDGAKDTDDNDIDTQT
jgi:hypothetical protein